METFTFVPETKGRSHGSNSEHKGLQIPILGTSELQIRWNGYKLLNTKDVFYRFIIAK